MAMFEKDEAFDFIKNFLQVDNAEPRMMSARRGLLDEILFSIHSRIPFQNISLMSKHPSQRRKPTLDELKSNFVSGVGGLCFDINISTFHLLTAVGFDVLMSHATVSSTYIFPNNHIVLFVIDLETKGDQFLADIALGHPLFHAISLDFEKESPVFVNSYLEFKFVKREGKLYRMHRRGDPLTMRGRQENSELEFWLDDWRRFVVADMHGTKNVSEFDEDHRIVYTNPEISSFHQTIKLISFTGGKAFLVLNEKTLIENDEGKLVITPIIGGDEGILSAINQTCPRIPDDLIRKSLLHWRQTTKDKEQFD